MNDKYIHIYYTVDIMLTNTTSHQANLHNNDAIYAYVVCMYIVYI